MGRVHLPRLLAPRSEVAPREVQLLYSLVQQGHTTQQRQMPLINMLLQVNCLAVKDSELGSSLRLPLEVSWLY